MERNLRLRAFWAVLASCGLGTACADGVEKCLEPGAPVTAPVEVVVDGAEASFEVVFPVAVSGAGATLVLPAGLSGEVSEQGRTWRVTVRGLERGTRHEVRLRGASIVDACEKTLGADVVVSVVSGIPRLVQSLPTNGAADIPSTAESVSLTFDLPLDPSVSSLPVERADDGLALGDAALLWDSTGLAASVTLPVLGAQTTYRLDLRGLRGLHGVPLDTAARLTDGWLVFTTSEGGNARPKLVSTTPVAGATWVPTVLPTIALRFDAPMDVLAGTATLSGGPGTVTVSFWEEERAVHLGLVGELAPGTTYTLAPGGFRGADGQPADLAFLGESRAFSFTTAPVAGETWTSCERALPLQNGVVVSPYVLPPIERTTASTSESCGVVAEGEDFVARYTMGTTGNTHLEVVVEWNLLNDTDQTHHEIWQGGCGSEAGGVEVACRYDDTGRMTYVFEAVPGDTYFFRSIAAYSDDTFHDYSIRVREFTPTPDPWETCQTAMPLENGVLARANLTAIDDRFNEGFGACDFEGPRGMNLVASYTVPAETTHEALRVVTNVVSDNFFNLYSTVVSAGSCRGPETLLCPSDAVARRTYELRTEPGETYTFDTILRLTGQSFWNYEITATEFTPAHAAWSSCETAFELTDGERAEPDLIPDELTNDGVGSCGAPLGMDLVSTYVTQGRGTHLRVELEAEGQLPTSVLGFEAWKGGCDAETGSEQLCVRTSETASSRLLGPVQAGERWFFKVLASGADRFVSHGVRVTEVTPSGSEAVDLADASDARRVAGQDACENPYVEWSGRLEAPLDGVNELAEGCAEANGGEVLFTFPVETAGTYTVDVVCPGCGAGALAGMPALLVSKVAAYESELFCGQARSMTTTLAAGDVLAVTVAEAGAGRWLSLGQQDVRVRVTRLDSVPPRHEWTLPHAGEGTDGTTPWDLRAMASAPAGCGEYVFRLRDLEASASRFEPSCNTSGYYSAELLLAWTMGAGSSWLDVRTCGSAVETLLSAGDDADHTAAACSEGGCGLQSWMGVPAASGSTVLLTLASLSREHFGSFADDEVVLTIVEK